MPEPCCINPTVVDTARAILDGHIVLSRQLAAENHYPSIDVLESISRLMTELATPGHKHAAGLLREVLATYASARDLVNIGAYAAGSNPAIDFALAMMPRVREYLRQDATESTDYAAAVEVLDQSAIEPADGMRPEQGRDDADRDASVRSRRPAAEILR